MHHGVSVPDPYRWLEDSKSEQTRAWIAAQNRLTQQHLGSLPHKQRLKDRLKGLWNYERFSARRASVSTTITATTAACSNTRC